MTDFSRPFWFISRACHTMTVLASNPSLGSILYHHLMKPTSSDSKRTFLVRLCASLAEPIIPVTEQQLVKIEAIISVFSSLVSIVQEPELGAHPSILSSLIILLSSMSGLLWDEDCSVLDSDGLAERAVRILYRAVLLFHGILCNGSTSGTSRLSSVLYELPKSRHEVWSSSLAHYYVVSIGRLSYAPVPHWLNGPCKEMIEASCDLAHELLELVIEGPEEDLIWSAFHDNTAQPELEPMEGC